MPVSFSLEGKTALVTGASRGLGRAIGGAGAVPVVHCVGPGWTDSGDFRSVEEWWRHFDRLSQRLANPITVAIDPAR